MQPVTRYYTRTNKSEDKFRCVMRLFVLELTASDTVQLTDLSGQAVNSLYLRFRCRSQA
jgi:transposase